MNQYWVIDAQWGKDIPDFVKEMIEKSHVDQELPNDVAYFSGDYMRNDEGYDEFVAWLSEKNIKPEEVLCHYWW